MDSFLKDNAPARGYFLALYRDAVLFAPYEIENGSLAVEGCENPWDSSMTQCHLFDENTECRILFRSSAGDRICQVFTQEQEREMDPDLIFAEKVLVKPEYTQTGRLPQTLLMINRYQYSESDTLTLKNYRIAAYHAPGEAFFSV